MISEHFHQTLLQHKFNKVDPAIYEFQELKKLVKLHYPQLSHSSLVWDAIFKHHSVKVWAHFTSSRDYNCHGVGIFHCARRF